MRALIVGLGSIAQRHIRNLRKVIPEGQIAVWRQYSRNADLGELAGLVDALAFDLEDALRWKPDIALITNPASAHVETGLALAQENVHLFVEKPLSNELTQVDELLDLCRRRGLALMVGYNFRFYQPLGELRRALHDGLIGHLVSIRAEVGQYLPDWRPGSDYRKGVSARRELGGGAVLELSHELDYVRWLAGEVQTVFAHMGRLGNLDIDVEDTAEIMLQFSGGGVGSVHLDMVQRSPMRQCRVVGTEGVLLWDGLCHRVQSFAADKGKWQDLFADEAYDVNETYIRELQHFLRCVEHGEAPAVGGGDARRVLEIALAAKKSARTQKMVVV